MTIQIDKTADLVAYNVGRDLACVMHKHHEGIAHGRYKDEDLEADITEIYKRQMQPLHAELKAYVKDSTPPKPRPIYCAILMGLALGALATLAIRNKMMHTVLMVMTIWISIFNEV
jgi:hypothetical protein